MSLYQLDSDLGTSSSRSLLAKTSAAQLEAIRIKCIYKFLNGNSECWNSVISKETPYMDLLIRVQQKFNILDLRSIRFSYQDPEIRGCLRSL
jgi:hypothetical protein